MGWAAESRAEGHADALEAGKAAALDALRLDWGSAWEIGCGDTWQAARRDGTGDVLTRASAGGLALALRISHGRPR